MSVHDGAHSWATTLAASTLPADPDL
jgi:hypothetical protein